MERGTERERAAVRERWVRLERRRAAATRLLRGLTIAGTGALLLLVAAATEVCFATVGGGVVDCTSAGSPAVAAASVAVGALAIGSGMWTCRNALRG